MAENITKQVLPGNPVTRDYEVLRHVGSAGPGLYWKVYSGFKKSTKQVLITFSFSLYIFSCLIMFFFYFLGSSNLCFT
jgi:hypothetical protein